jgi:hypothetical protein
MGNFKALSNKKIIKRSGKILSTNSDEATLEMVDAIIKDYLSKDSVLYVDYIECVQVCEKREFSLNSQEFLEEISLI